jgi:hypothetical protein
VVLACSSMALAEPRWMGEEAIRAEIAGKALEGYFYNGPSWTGRYDKDGRFEGCDERLCGTGRWFTRNGWLCLLGGSPRWDPTERCAAVIRIGANCYQFHWAFPLAKGEVGPDSLWHSRGWRQGEPSTCEDKPSV